MHDNTTEQQGNTEVQKAKRLFEFVRELNRLKNKKVPSNILAYDSVIYTNKDIPTDIDSVHFTYRDESTDTPVYQGPLLKICRTEYTDPPKPDDSFKDWLEFGWNNPNKPCRLKNSIRKNKDDGTITEYYFDDIERMKKYNSWLEKRNQWAKSQANSAKANKLFDRLYSIAVNLERDGETMELIVADGFLRDYNNSAVDHPILTRRVKIHHEAENNTIYIEDVDVDTNVYAELFNSDNISNVNQNAVKHLADALDKDSYHPLGRGTLDSLFQTFINELAPTDGKYIKGEYDANAVNNAGARIVLYHNPCYILRKRVDGAIKAINNIIEDIDNTNKVPNPIADIISTSSTATPQEKPRELTIDERLAEVGGESADILLSKEANREQLEIARRIEHCDAVVVQGPPGTGKTHTIANLLGHFFAQGKTVLVTSGKDKALSVLEDKIVPGLRDLCVSVIGDSNKDMEKSINVITEQMSKCTSYQLEDKVKKLKGERQQVIKELADVRKQIFNILRQEYQHLTYKSKDISPSEAGEFIHNHPELEGVIPGKVERSDSLPLNHDELAELYESNDKISAEDETELSYNLPDPSTILTPEDFDDICKKRQDALCEFKKAEDEIGGTVKLIAMRIQIGLGDKVYKFNLPDKGDLTELQRQVNEASTIDEEWEIQCILDGKNNDQRKPWLQLTSKISETTESASKFRSQKIGKDISIKYDASDLRKSIECVKEHYAKSHKIGAITRKFNKVINAALDKNNISINDHALQNVDDCNLALSAIDFHDAKADCERYWDDLIASNGGPKFSSLDPDNPEQIAGNYINHIDYCLDWNSKNCRKVKDTFNKLLMADSAKLFQRDLSSTDKDAMQSTVDTIKKLVTICKTFSAVYDIKEVNDCLLKNLKNLQTGQLYSSKLCSNLASIYSEVFSNLGSDHYTDDVRNKYKKCYDTFRTTYDKLKIQEKRAAYLDKLKSVAPDWANAIKKRNGIHGANVMPNNLDEAWRWKQYYTFVSSIINKSADELQQKSVTLSKRYREITGKYAEAMAWLHVLRRTESNTQLRKSLANWGQTMNKIGKGTGRRAATLRADARRLMANCQTAVPGWVMPINKALDTLNPKLNKFDVVIIDEASQLDPSALAILYMGRKLIVVGDDKQVSPLGIGQKIDDISNLQQRYLKDIPGSSLYDPSTSIYDIASGPFQPLMLREHFRCVPDIIGFSNQMFYNGKIKPLRDGSSSKLLPATVSYRVADGARDVLHDTNVAEADNIVALLRACLSLPEYKNKTFGVISLLGNDQVDVIERKILKYIDAPTCSKHHIICGNSANFQGDERDVIFLSMVNSPNTPGQPVNLLSAGNMNSNYKRYNVAASRAKDQLWVVHSFDPSTELKSGDIRRKLIEYAENPKGMLNAAKSIADNSESVFEEQVATKLFNAGYHIRQQYEVGSYRIDIVAICGNNKVAIECDGNAYHSGEEKVREDMERQAILERAGWKFIRIRGSEFFSNPDTTMQRVFAELKKLNIEPEAGTASSDNQGETSDLLERVKAKAAEFLTEMGADNSDSVDTGTIAYALDPNKTPIEQLAINSTN